MEETDVKKITKQECLHWRAEYGKKYSATVTNGTLSILRRVLDIAVDAGVRYDNPAKAKQVKRVSAKRVEAAGTGPILYAHQPSSGRLMLPTAPMGCLRKLLIFTDRRSCKLHNRSREIAL